jgi:hypothetical protein
MSDQLHTLSAVFPGRKSTKYELNEDMSWLRAGFNIAGKNNSLYHARKRNKIPVLRFVAYPTHWLSYSDLSQFLNQVKYSETDLKLHYWFTLWARIRSISCKLMVIDWLRRATWCTVPHNQSHSDVKAVVNLAAADLCQHECLPWNGDCKVCTGVTIQLTDGPGSGTSGQVLIFDCKRTPSALAGL